MKCVVETSIKNIPKKWLMNFCEKNGTSVGIDVFTKENPIFAKNIFKLIYDEKVSPPYFL